MDNNYQNYTQAYAQMFSEGMKPDEIERRISQSQHPADPAEAAETVVEPMRERARLKVITGEDLLEKRFKPQSFIVDTLLKPGLAVLAGSPKVGKSWLVLHLCLQISKGEPFWGMQTEQGSVLYIALEDTERRLRQRLLSITDECPPDLCVTNVCHPISEELEEELTDFCVSRPHTKLVVIDTFQKIRTGGRELSYSNDYSEVSWLKDIADRLGVCILLVHHTRKLADNDTFNEISGTNGIAGSADTLMVIKKEKRSQNKATLTCTGRDIEDRQIGLRFDRESCTWELSTDSLQPESTALCDEMHDLAAYMKRIITFEGSNADFCSGYNGFCGRQLSPRLLKRYMNRSREQLLTRGVDYVSVKSGDKRLIKILYCEDLDQSLKEEGKDQTVTEKREPTQYRSVVPEPSEYPSAQPQIGDPMDGSLNRDDDYMDSLLNDDAYIPRTSMSEADLIEEQEFWDAFN